MPVYSVPLPDKSIIKALEGTKKVRIIACGLCDNWSLAYHKNQPIYEIKKEGDKTTRTPYSSYIETDRFKKLLKKKGIESDIEFMPQLCIYSEDPTILEASRFPWKGNDFIERCLNSDAILCLGCSATYMGLRRRLGDEFLIVPGLKSIGAIQVQEYMDESGRFVLMNYEDSTVITNK
jgi:hypothetical protein